MPAFRFYIDIWKAWQKGRASTYTSDRSPPKILKSVFVFVVVLSMGLATPGFAAKKKKKKSTCGATSIEAGNCPKEGCGGDAELNKRKNLVTPASSPEEYTRSNL